MPAGHPHKSHQGSYLDGSLRGTCMFTLERLQLRPTVMLNSSNCNLRCRYCYCEKSRAQAGEMMDIETADAVIGQFVRAYPRFISFCWHGGEPLYRRTVGFYEALVALEKKHQAEGQLIENRVQTNGTLITNSWAEFFKTHDFKVGVSIDGPEWLNDIARVSMSGKGTYSRITRGIDFLRAQAVPFSVILVITNHSVNFPEEIYDYIVREGFTTVNLNPCFGNQFAVDPVSYAHFMNRVFDLWMGDDRENLTLGFFENIIRWFRGGEPIVCHLRNSCYRHVKIDWNGDVLPCDEFLGQGSTFGNVVREDLADIVNGETYRNFYALTTHQVPACESCEWRNLCRGGCSRYSIEQTFAKHLNTMCESRKIMFSHIAEVLR